MSRIRIVTRESPLALWQANDVKQRLTTAHPHLLVDIVGMTTAGDRDKTSPLASIGGKGVFVKELETALLSGTADIAVHSMKDVPAFLPPGLEIAAICEREDSRDAFVSNAYPTVDALPQGARVGTSSLRRRLQLQAHFPHLLYPDLRGNVETRLRKLDEGQYDAIILATAGLVRLDLSARIRERIDQALSLPAAGQGAVGIECRSDASEVKRLLMALNHTDTALAVSCERLISAGLGANCNLPIGALAEVDGDHFSIAGFVGDARLGNHLRVARSGRRGQATALAEAVTAELLTLGARDLIPEA
jgi:hydroxymethylbilane synthase